MNITWFKNFLMIVLKNALNAVITNAGLMATMHGVFNRYSRDGLWNMGKATLVVIAAREAMVWGPVLLKWSTTNAEPSA
jgi:hypothetical protein